MKRLKLKYKTVYFEPRGTGNWVCFKNIPRSWQIGVVWGGLRKRWGFVSRNTGYLDSATLDEISDFLRQVNKERPL